MESNAVTAADYFSAPGLSVSGMKDMAVSPYRFWYLHVNPEPPMIEPTPAMLFGSALHCAVLESDEFDKRYARKFTPPEGCLVTIEDLRGWLRDKGFQPKGTRKDGIISQVMEIEPAAPVYDVLESKYMAENKGKTILSPEDYDKVFNCAKSLLEEPRVNEILSNGQAEVPIFAKDTDTGVPLKAKMDWVAPKVTLDLKTFSATRGKSIDRAIADAIYYEGYHRQAYHYTLLRELAGMGSAEFVLAFVESEPPHEVRIRSIRRHHGGALWGTAQVQVRGFIAAYKEYMDHFGTKPWRYAQDVVPVEDDEVTALAFA